MAITSGYTLLSDTPSPKECYKCDGSVTDFLKMFHQFMVMNEWTPRWCWTTIFEVPHVTLYLVWTKMAHGSGNLPQEGKTTCWIGHFWTDLQPTSEVPNVGLEIYSFSRLHLEMPRITHLYQFYIHIWAKTHEIPWPRFFSQHNR